MSGIHISSPGQRCHPISVYGDIVQNENPYQEWPLLVRGIFDFNATLICLKKDQINGPIMKTLNSHHRQNLQLSIEGAYNTQGLVQSNWKYRHMIKR